MNTIIRFDCQSAYNRGVNDNEPEEYVQSLGMTVVQFKYSSFGACYFMEVENYAPDPQGICVKLDIKPEDFKWESY